jgi:hypothetical protein
LSASGRLIVNVRIPSSWDFRTRDMLWGCEFA